MLRLLCVLSHVYSQLRYSWPGIPDCRPGEMDDLRQDFSADIFSFSPDDWSGLIERLTEAYPVKLPWLGSWCREHDPGGRRLSANIARHLDLVKNECAHYITYDDERYPESLRFIPDPPLAITLSGKTESLNKPCVSVIGSRKASAFALQESF
jgi:hypothetical protein